jgi:hypothetical protein
MRSAGVIDPFEPILAILDPGATAPLVHRAITFLALAKCPGCGEPYVPPSLPTT